MNSVVDAFIDWANSIAALAVSGSAARLRMLKTNEDLTTIAMYHWRLHEKEFVMKKPNRIWLDGQN